MNAIPDLLSAIREAPVGQALIFDRVGDHDAWHFLEGLLENMSGDSDLTILRFDIAAPDRLPYFQLRDIILYHGTKQLIRDMTLHRFMMSAARMSGIGSALTEHAMMGAGIKDSHVFLLAHPGGHFGLFSIKGFYPMFKAVPSGHELMIWNEALRS